MLVTDAFEVEDFVLLGKEFLGRREGREMIKMALAGRISIDPAEGPTYRYTRTFAVGFVERRLSKTDDITS